MRLGTVGRERRLSEIRRFSAPSSHARAGASCSERSRCMADCRMSAMGRQASSGTTSKPSNEQRFSRIATAALPQAVSSALRSDAISSGVVVVDVTSGSPGAKAVAPITCSPTQQFGTAPTKPRKTHAVDGRDVCGSRLECSERAPVRPGDQMVFEEYVVPREWGSSCWTCVLGRFTDPVSMRVAAGYLRASPHECLILCLSFRAALPARLGSPQGVSRRPTQRFQPPATWLASRPCDNLDRSKERDSRG